MTLQPLRGKELRPIEMTVKVLHNKGNITLLVFLDF